VRQRFERGRLHFPGTYLHLADEWGVWDNRLRHPGKLRRAKRTAPAQLHAMLHPDSIQETPEGGMSQISEAVLEAGRVATEKMLDLCKRTGIEVTPQMTLVRKEAALPARDNA
jgi:hypothetical protein